jgi:hypothetical protein
VLSVLRFHGQATQSPHEVWMAIAHKARRPRADYARILQHEIDHLNGILYVDRMQARTLTSLDNLERVLEGWCDIGGAGEGEIERSRLTREFNEVGVVWRSIR